MPSRLVMNLPIGNVTATSLDVEAFAHHLRPGSGKHFMGRTILAELRPLAELRFLPEGGWRDPVADCAAALAATDAGKRTKTALSNAAFLCTPLSAVRAMYLGKTGGEVLALEGPDTVATFTRHDCHEQMSPAEVAQVIGQPGPATRVPRLYLVLAPIEFLVLSNLTPAEYVWYATHRPGKKFRQVMFTEVDADPSSLVSLGKIEHAREELTTNPGKKTKTLVSGDLFNQLSLESWVGIDGKRVGGLYTGDADGAYLWRFPKELPHPWERAP